MKLECAHFYLCKEYYILLYSRIPKCWLVKHTDRTAAEAPWAEAAVLAAAEEEEEEGEAAAAAAWASVAEAAGRLSVGWIEKGVEFLVLHESPENCWTAVLTNEGKVGFIVNRSWLELSLHSSP